MQHGMFERIDIMRIRPCSDLGVETYPFDVPYTEEDLEALIADIAEVGGLSAPIIVCKDISGFFRVAGRRRINAYKRLYHRTKDPRGNKYPL